MASWIEVFITSNAKKAVGGLMDLAGATEKTKSEIMALTGDLKELGKMLIKTTDESDKYTASLRLLNTVLGDSAEKATSFISRLSEMSGLNETTLTKQVAKFTQLGESLNLSTEYSEEFAESLSILSTKLSMLYNTDYEAMANKLQRAIQGTQTSLKSATGIYANEVSEQQLLMENGINREISSLNDAEKAILRYATILKQVSNDNNVYQQSVNSLAWQKQMLTAQIHRLANAVGQVLTPVFTKLLTIINAVIMVVTELISALGALFGINVDLSSGTKEAADGYNALAKGIGGAAKAANKSLRGFDKLNNITTPPAGGGGGGSSPLGIDNSFLKLLKKADESFLNIRNKAQQIKDNLLDWLGIVKVIDPVTGKISNYMKATSKASEFWDRFVGAINVATAVAPIIAPFTLLVDAIDVGVNMVRNFKKETDKLSETSTETIQRLLPVKNAFKELVQTVNEVSYDGLALTDEGKTKIVNSIDKLTQELKAALKSYVDENIKNLNYLYYEVGVIDEETYKERLEKLEEFNTERTKEIEENGEKLKTQTAQIFDENGHVIMSAYAEWLQGLQDYENKSLISLTTSEKDKQSIMSKMQNADRKARQEYYSDLLKGYIKDKEDAKAAAQEKYEKTLEAARNTFSEGSKEYAKISQMAKKTYDQEVADAENAYDSIFKAFQENNQDIANSIDRDDGHVKNSWSEFWGNLLQGAKDTLSKISNAWKGLTFESKTANINVKSAGASGGYRALGYDTGGFPKEGELFYARENGPELVGSINGHSAVANNDQIVQGIQSGVFSGMMSALRNTDFGGGDVVIEATGDTEGLLNFISFKQKQKDRQFN